jgi:hypothetical protein
MLVTAPGRPIHRRVRWHYSARGGYLAVRTFVPHGRAMRVCSICGRMHATGLAAVVVCPTLGEELDRTLERSHAMSSEQNVVFQAPRRTLTEREVREQHYKLAQQRLTVERLARELEADEAALRQAARDAGHGLLLRALETPPAPTPAEPRGRYRVLKAYRIFRAGQEFSSAAGAVMALPLAIAQQLGERVEAVPSDTPIQGRPLAPGALVDD